MLEIKDKEKSALKALELITKNRYFAPIGQNYRKSIKRENSRIKSYIHEYLWQKYHYLFLRWHISVQSYDDVGKMEDLQTYRVR